ncbi:MAG: ATP-binding protein [Nanoarchaeota archaeon]|nr:ATP-binding protein [Nanoarchaeota archaeon]
MKNILKSIIADFHKNELNKFVKRDLKIPLESNKIITIIGVRRSGKTYYLYQTISELLKKTKKENIVYINFEDERLNLKEEDLSLILEAYYELYPDYSNKLYFFFDEIQNVEGWERFVRRIYDTVTKNIFITGSSSKLLSKEIATSLRGRSITYDMYPLSFKEYLRFNNTDYKDIYSTRGKARINNLFNKYLMQGGFPEVINYDEELRNRILQSYLNVMIYRDLIERYNIRNTYILKLLIKKGISNTAKTFSINKYYNELKSQGIKISKDSLYEFADYIEDCFMLFNLHIYVNSIIKQNLGEKKLYCIDNGLINAVSFKFSDDRGRLLENLVFLELKRREKELYYHKEKQECDFVVLDKMTVVEAIQVTESLDNAKTRKREISGLIDAMKTYKLKKGLIVTANQFEDIKEDGYDIKIRPAWLWLLE